MTNYVFAIAALAVIAAAVPAMAQTQTAAPVTAAQPTDTTGGRWVLLQGIGKHDRLQSQWFYVRPGDRNFPDYR